MSELPGFEPRSICPRCRRPESVCYCPYLTRIETKTRIVLLQHPRERDMAIGTAHMANLCLPNSELFVGFDWENSAALRGVLAEPGRGIALLYPGPDATDLHESLPAEPLTLIVVDGTWANTKKMVKANPLLANLPRVTFRAARPSEYRIRREPAAECVSTIEALMYVLGALEGNAQRFEGLLLPFRKMVDNQLNCKAIRCSPRSRYKRPDRVQRSQVPAQLLSHSANVVCIVGEANAWPCRELEQRAAHPDELVQWVAHRVATGETFECFVAPRHPLSPGTPLHIEIDADKLHAGESLSTLLKRWRDFVREDDILCSWGRYATGLLLKSGGYLPESRFDLRTVAKHQLKRNIGTLEEFHASIATQPQGCFGQGRAGLRLGKLTQIAAHFCRGGGERAVQP